ncbi:hypothetical protein BC936DRAFT_138259, partial [Jimgerdemannia flammicorona]
MFAGDELAFSRASLFREEPAVRLRKAAIEGNVHAVKRLIKKVPNMQCPDPENGWFVLILPYSTRPVRLSHRAYHFSRETRRGEPLHMLKKYTFNCFFLAHRTVLMYAARYGHVELVNFLLENEHEDKAISVVRW